MAIGLNDKVLANVGESLVEYRWWKKIGIVCVMNTNVL